MIRKAETNGRFNLRELTDFFRTAASPNAMTICPPLRVSDTLALIWRTPSLFGT